MNFISFEHSKGGMLTKMFEKKNTSSELVPVQSTERFPHI